MSGAGVGYDAYPKEDVSLLDKKERPTELGQAILRTVAYHREDHDRAVIWFDRSEHQSILPGILCRTIEDYNQASRWFKPSEPSEPDVYESVLQGMWRSYGYDRPFPRLPLTEFPLELLMIVFLHLDVRTLFGMRHVNVKLRCAVDNLAQYRQLVDHCLNFYRAILCTRLRYGPTLLQV
jgi:hypothetical protein